MKLGDIVQGKLIEAIDNSHWIVSFNGKLIQVVNASPLEFSKGKTVNLQVTKERPLELKIFSQRYEKRSIDVKV